MNMQYFTVKVAYKLFSSDRGVNLGTARISYDKNLDRIYVPAIEFDYEEIKKTPYYEHIQLIEKSIKENLQSYLRPDHNRVYSIIWNEDSCIETEIKDLN